MFNELKKLQEKYQLMKEHAEYVDIGQVVNDLYYTIQHEQLRRDIRRGEMLLRDY